jgi:hypothetical protein
MPDDVVVCIRCGHASAQGVSPAPASAPAPSSVRKKFADRIRGVNWLRVSAAVLTSNLFFFASCTAGVLISGVLKDADDYGPAITEGYPVPKLATVVATVPDNERQGQRKSVIVFVSSLDEFQKKNPEYSYLLSPGRGRVENTGAEMITNYVVTPLEAGKIVVKSDFHHDVPPAGLDVKTRYEATDKSIRVLNAKYGSGLGEALIAGLIFATVLLLTGKAIQWRLGPDASAALVSAGKPRTGASRFVRILGAVIAGIAFGLIFLFLFLFG